MSKILYAAAGILLVLVTALFLFIRSNAFITPSSNQINLTITIAPTLTQQQLLPIKSTPKDTAWICPANGWINCMPIIKEARKYQCEDEYINWVKANCPNFQGVAY